MGKQSVFVHSNAEIVRFEKDYKLVIFKACKDAKLRRCDWEAVKNLVLEKYAWGKIEYDPARGTKPTTYYYAIAFHCAKDELRKQRFVELDSKLEAEIRDEHDLFAVMEKKDEQRIVVEAFRRLAMECRDKQKVQILLRYVVNGEERTRLAEELGVTNDYVSLVKSRWLPCLQKLVRQVIQEDRDGRLNFNKNDVRYLKTYMMNW